MTERIEFGSKAAADAAREEHAEHLCSDDDRRLKTVAFSSDTPEHVLESATVQAAAGRTERDGTGQVELTDGERDRIDFTETNVLHARSVKAIAADEGVDDWTAYYDAQLTVDEHRELMERAAREGGGRRMDNEDTIDERLARTEAAVGGQCDHAATHCEDGDDDACTFLTETCGYDEDEVQSLLSEFDDPIPADEIEGKWRGALKRSWNGYRGAIADLETALAMAGDAVENAVAAAKAINGIRQAHGQDEIEEFHRLEQLQRPLRWNPTDDLAGAPVRTDDETNETDETDGTIFVDPENIPDEGADGPSREFRAAQQDGYLRQSDGETLDEREGLGQFGARRSDTTGLDEFETAEGAE